MRACEKPGDDRFASWPLLLEAHAALVDRLEAELKARGGPPLTWYDVMVQLSSAPDGALPMKELAESLLLSRSGATRLVDRMADAGLVERAPCGTDRRVVYARLTPQGREEFERVRPEHIRDVERYFSEHLTDEEALVLRGVFQKVVGAARDPSDAHAPAGSSRVS